MILTLAIGAGILIGLTNARLRKQPYHLPDLAWIWLGVVAFLPQWFAFYLPATRQKIPDPWASTALIVSQFLLLLFMWVNRQKSGFWILGVGLLLNLVVIILNHGWMPISPAMVTRLFPQAPAGSWAIGERLGTGKDIVLNLKDMRLGFLGDQIMIPFPRPLHPTAFSVGDFLIAFGAARFLSHQPKTQPKPAVVLNSQNQPTI